MSLVGMVGGRPIGRAQPLSVDEVGQNIARLVVRQFTDPKRRAFMAGYLTTMYATAWLASKNRGHPGPVVSVLLSWLGGQAAMRAWQATQDVRAIAAAAEARADPPQEEAPDERVEAVPGVRRHGND